VLPKQKRRLSQYLALCLCVVAAALSGCGGDSSQAQAGSSANSAESGRVSASGGRTLDVRQVKKEIRSVVKALTHKRLVCHQLSDHFLKYNYGASGKKGREKCAAEVQGKNASGVRSIRFIAVRARFVSAIVEDSQEDSTKLNFVRVGARWLLDSAASAGSG